MSTIERPLHVNDVGSLFVKAGVISEPQLDRARWIVAKRRDRRSVVELLVELGQLGGHLQLPWSVEDGQRPKKLRPWCGFLAQPHRAGGAPE